MKALGVLTLLGGLIALLALPVHAERAWRLRRRGVRTTGRVLDHVVAPGKVKRMGAEFVDQRGQKVSLVIHRLDMRNADVFAVGKQFDVLYLPTRPTDARPAKLMANFRRNGLYSRYLLLGLYLEGIMVTLIKLMLVEAGNPKGPVAEYRLRRQVRKHGIRAQATVIWHEHNEHNKRNSGMRPLIGYVDQDGRTRTFEADTREEAVLPPIGRVTPVTYDPNPSWTWPEDAPVAAISSEIPTFTTFFNRFLGILIVFVLGVFLLTI